MTVAGIIPALNEEAAIGRVVAAIPRDLVDIVVVVDNGSCDGTAHVAREAGAVVVSQPIRGYGAAMIAGVAAIGDATAYVFVDGDGSDVLDRLPEMLGLVSSGTARLVLGVRAAVAEPGAMPWHQRLGNRTVAWTLRRMTGRRLRDLPSLKVVDGDTYRSLEMRERSYGWTVEMITKAALRGIAIAEVDTGCRRRIGASKVSGSPRGSVVAGYRIAGAMIRAWRAERGTR
jgi:glycosyltransferase involved in cell wall biosynthesis